MLEVLCEVGRKLLVSIEELLKACAVEHRADGRRHRLVDAGPALHQPERAEDIAFAALVDEPLLIHIHKPHQPGLDDIQPRVLCAVLLQDDIAFLVHLQRDIAQHLLSHRCLQSVERGRPLQQGPEPVDDG